MKASQLNASDNGNTDIDNKPNVIRGAHVLDASDPSLSIDNDEKQAPENATNYQANGSLQGSTEALERVEWTTVVDELGEQSVISPAKDTNKRARKWLWLAVIVVGLGVLEVALFVREAFVNNDMLGFAWLGAFVVAIGFCLRELYASKSAYIKLDKHASFRRDADELVVATSIGQGTALCAKISQSIGPNFHQSFQQWDASLAAHYTDSEVLALFEKQMIAPIDREVVNYITQNAGASGAMIAVSPFALLDMLIVVWRNLTMIRHISKCYGLELGYWGRVSLIKRIFKTMLLAGAAEIISDAGNAAIGTGVTAKVSTRVAQGIGAGVLTMRIGLKAMNECRPISWQALPQPGVRQLSENLIKDLSKLI